MSINQSPSPPLMRDARAYTSLDVMPNNGGSAYKMPDRTLNNNGSMDSLHGGTGRDSGAFKRSGSALDHIGSKHIKTAMSSNRFNSLNHSLDIAPRNDNGRTLRQAGSSMLPTVQGSAIKQKRTLDYGAQSAGKPRTVRPDPYKNISVSDMFQREAAAQYDGIIPRYKLPDTQKHL